MTTTRGELVDQLYRGMNARDRDAVTGLCHADVEWRWPDNTPGGAVFRGRSEIVRGLQQWEESWEELVMDPAEVLEDGDYTLVITTYRMRGLGSGVYLEQQVAHLHQFEDGLLRRWWMFGDPEKARRRFLEGDRPGI